MKWKSCFLLISFFISFSSYSQNKYINDSIKVPPLITEKINSLQNCGATNPLFLFSNIGNAVIIYEIKNKIVAIKCKNFDQQQKFRKTKLSVKDKMDYKSCINLVKADTSIFFSNCEDFVHSFNRIYFNVTIKEYCLKGCFTSDCGNELAKSNLASFFNLYKNVLL